MNHPVDMSRQARTVHLFLCQLADQLEKIDVRVRDLTYWGSSNIHTLEASSQTGVQHLGIGCFPKGDGTYYFAETAVRGARQFGTPTNIAKVAEAIDKTLGGEDPKWLLTEPRKARFDLWRA